MTTRVLNETSEEGGFSSTLSARVTKTREADDHVEYVVTISEAREVSGEPGRAITILTRYSAMEGFHSSLRAKVFAAYFQNSPLSP